MEEKRLVFESYGKIRTLKRLCFQTVKPNVRWKGMFLATFLLLSINIGVAKGDQTSSLGRPPALAQALLQNDNPDLIGHWGQLENYMTRYGYLMSSPSHQLINGGNLRTEDRLRESVKMMQKFGNIPETGVIDRRTLGLLHRKRCGMPDVLYAAERARRFAIQGQKWERTNLTWSVRDYPPNMDPGMVRRELTKAFKVWSDASKLEFKEIHSTRADIVVSFLRGDHNDGYPFDGRGIVLAHAFFPGDDIGGDAHFDAEEPWVHDDPPPGGEGVSLFAVAAHEFGHSLGLSHSSVSGSLMNPFYQSIKDNFQLPRDDTFGIQTLYGSRTPTRWEPLAPYPPGPPTMPPRRPSYPTRRPTGKPYPPDTSTPRTRQRPPTKPPGHPKKPHTCNTTFDALSVIRREVFIFKGKYFWRLDGNGLMKDYPAEIRRFWYDAELDKVDAVYERPIDTKIVFFSGKQYWLFNGNVKERGYPRPITDLGLPPNLEKIDAAMVWGYNGKTYLFSGSRYWRYDESEGRVELDYPRDMAMWRGVPYHIDAAFQYNDGHTYFFKGRRFWRFNDHLMRVHNEKPGDITEHWFGCPSRTEVLPKTADEETDHVEDKVTDIFLSDEAVVRTPKAVMNLIFIFVIAFQKLYFS